MIGDAFIRCPPCRCLDFASAGRVERRLTSEGAAGTNRTATAGRAGGGDLRGPWSATPSRSAVRLGPRRRHLPL